MRCHVVSAVFALLVMLAAVSAYSQYEPFVVEIDPQNITFHVDGPPGSYGASSPVNVSVSSGFSEWTLHCQASPLIEVTEGWAIPPSRIYLEGGFEDLAGGGESMVSLDGPILVGEGTFTGPELVLVNILTFKIMAEWQDKPGTYNGQITFTYLAVP